MTTHQILDARKYPKWYQRALAVVVNLTTLWECPQCASHLPHWPRTGRRVGYDYASDNGCCKTCNKYEAEMEKLRKKIEDQKAIAEIHRERRRLFERAIKATHDGDIVAAKNYYSRAEHLADQIKDQ